MDVKQWKSDCRAMCARLNEQFPDGVCYLASVLNREKNSVPGKVVECSNNRAAELIVNGTHILASDDQIKALHEAAEQRAVANQAAEARRVLNDVQYEARRKGIPVTTGLMLRSNG